MLTLIAAALFCSVLSGLFDKKSALGAVIKTVCGIFMLISLVSPWGNLRLDTVFDTMDGIESDGEALTAQASAEAKESMASVIKARTQTYILDKAESLGAQLTVEVSLDGSDVPTPVGVTIRGSISPYAKKQLTQIISEDLGIEAEEQQWIG